MSEKHTIKAGFNPDGVLVEYLPDGTTRPIEDETDWAKLEAMTDEDIDAGAESDPDNPPLTVDELARLRPVPNPREIRKRLRLTQQQFAARFGVPLGTLRDWEQGAREPDTAAKSYLHVIARNPEAVIQALEG